MKPVNYAKKKLKSRIIRPIHEAIEQPQASVERVVEKEREPIETLMEGLPISMADGSVRIFGDNQSPYLLVFRETQVGILQNQIPPVSLQLSQVLKVFAPQCPSHLQVFDIQYLVSFLAEVGHRCIGEQVEEKPNEASTDDCTIGWTASESSTKWLRSLFGELAYWINEQNLGIDSAELRKLDILHLIPIQGGKLLKFGLRAAVISTVDSSIPELKGAWILDPEIPESESALCYKHHIETVRVVKQMKVKQNKNQNSGGL